MNPQFSIDTNLQVSAMAAGGPPIGTGRLSFPSQFTARLATNAQTFARRVTFADLATVGSNREFKLTNSAAPYFLNINGGAAARNPAGGPIELFTAAGLLYIKTNVQATVIPGLFPGVLPVSVSAAGVILIQTELLGNAPTAAGQSVFGLSWPLSLINAAGQSNFYCDLVFAAFL